MFQSAPQPTTLYDITNGTVAGGLTQLLQQGLSAVFPFGEGGNAFADPFASAQTVTTGTNSIGDYTFATVGASGTPFDNAQTLPTGVGSDGGYNYATVDMGGTGLGGGAGAYALYGLSDVEPAAVATSAVSTEPLVYAPESAVQSYGPSDGTGVGAPTAYGLDAGATGAKFSILGTYNLGQGSGTPDPLEPGWTPTSDSSNGTQYADNGMLPAAPISQFQDFLSAAPEIGPAVGAGQDAPLNYVSIGNYGADAGSITLYSPGGCLSDAGGGCGSNCGSNCTSDCTSDSPCNDSPCDDGPVVLDLKGNGININPLSRSNMFFDMANDGYEQQTAWAGAGNGVLVYDPGGGPVTQADQVNFTLWDPSAKTDMQALEQVFDTNHDGVLNASDADWDGIGAANLLRLPRRERRSGLTKSRRTLPHCTKLIRPEAAGSHPATQCRSRG
ncbi:MAG: hypothetical protein ACLQKK_16455 [Rhodomicrobium sp.]